MDGTEWILKKHTKNTCLQKNKKQRLQSVPYIFPLTPDQPPFKGGRYVIASASISLQSCLIQSWARPFMWCKSLQWCSKGKYPNAIVKYYSWCEGSHRIRSICTLATLSLVCIQHSPTSGNTARLDKGHILCAVRILLLTARLRSRQCAGKPAQTYTQHLDIAVLKSKSN